MNDEQIIAWINRYLKKAVYDDETGMVELTFVIGKLWVQITVPQPLWIGESPDDMRFLKKQIIAAARLRIRDRAKSLIKARNRYALAGMDTRAHQLEIEKCVERDIELSAILRKMGEQS